MRVAIITNHYKSATELWMWRQVNILNENIKYIGILDSVHEQEESEIPVIGLLETNSKIALNPFFLIRKLSSLEKLYNIDIYYIHYLTNAFLLKDFILLTDKKIFVHCHGFDLTWNLKFHNNSEKNYHTPQYLSFVSNIPEKIVLITDSEFSKNQLISKGIIPDRIKVLYFGVPIEGVNKSKNDKSFKILYLGRFVDFKGPDLTILAFEKACENGLHGELLMVGDGPLMITCQLLKSRSQFSRNIKFFGTLPYESAKKLREECHIFTAHNAKGFITNQEEAYGVSIIEAMSAGLPIITGNNGGIKETVIHNKTGFLFEPGDINAHARYLLELAQNKPKRLSMSQNALKHVMENFTLEKEKKTYMDILETDLPKLHRTRIEKNKFKNVTIIGPYRFHNFGDDLIGAIIGKYIQAKSFNVCIPMLSQENCNWLKFEYSSDYIIPQKKSETIVIGGGGLLGDAGIKPDDYYRLLALKSAVMGRLNGKRVIITGIGAGPLVQKKSIILTRIICALSENLGVRDKESRVFLEKIGISKSKLIEGADLALLCSNYLKFDKIPSNKIGIQFDINSYSDVLKSNPKVYSIIKAIFTYISKNTSNIILISNNNKKSTLFSKSFDPYCETLCYKELETFLPRLSGLKAIFTSHLHLAIVAYSLKIPCFSLYVREKTRRFYDQIGYPDRAIDLKKATIDDFTRLIQLVETETWKVWDDSNLERLQKQAINLLNIIN